MPEQTRGSEFLQTLGQARGAVVRCTSCPGFKSPFQADCVCCGREVVNEDVKAYDAISAKAAMQPPSCTDTEVPMENVPQSATHLVGQQLPSAAQTRALKGRPQRIAPILRNSITQRPGPGSDGAESFGLHSASLKNSLRIHQRSQYAIRLPLSRRPTAYVQRGRPPVRLSGYKGVRTRKGVKGFLVEIRPPKWKKTIWLGTYNTCAEAAGAYDAGVFYTKKSNTKYNFRSSEGAFPPLPSHLRLDNADSMEEIKLFVQKQAQEAARRVKSIHTVPSCQKGAIEMKRSLEGGSSASVISPSSSCLTDDSSNQNVDPPPTDSSEVIEPINEIIDIPMDYDYLLWNTHESIFEEIADSIAEYTNYFQQGAQITSS